MRRIRVLAADSDPQMREILPDLFALDHDFELVEIAGDVETAMALAADTQPDIALLSVDLDGGGGPRASRGIRRASPKSRVVALSTYQDRDTIMAMFRAGVVGYLVKGTTPSRRIIDTLRRTAAGEIILPPTVAAHVADELATRLEGTYEQELSQRETRARIRGVLASGRLDIAFQPIFDLRTDVIIGVEALARFPGEPQRPPNVWFADAEAVGMSRDLELLAVRRALDAAGALPKEVYVAVNVSPDVAVHDTLHALVLAARPTQTVVEITEHAPIDDYASFNRNVEALRTAGVRIAIDDAGAGFASLRHILLAAPDVIKLDVTLTRDIHQDRARQALAKALITFATQIEATVVAEGIETTEELACLRDYGVTYGQGYLLGRPCPPGVAAEWIASSLSG